MGSSSLVKPPAHISSPRSSSAGGALGISPAAPAGLVGVDLVGDWFKAMFPI